MTNIAIDDKDKNYFYEKSRNRTINSWKGDPNYLESDRSKKNRYSFLGYEGKS